MKLISGITPIAHMPLFSDAIICQILSFNMEPIYHILVVTRKNDLNDLNNNLQPAFTYIFLLCSTIHLLFIH
jgi:hypothetical protein